MDYRVVVVDDHRLVRSIFASVIGDSEHFRLAASFARAEDAVQYFRTETADLVIMDVVMPGRMDGLEAAEEIKKLRPSVKVLIVTSMPEVSFTQKARKIGVESFWYKEMQELPLLTVMERTMQGESVYPEEIPQVILGEASGTSFTERELDVLRGLVGGRSNAEIAETLGISEGTVKMHVANMLQKTGFRSRLELAVRARAEGFVIEDR